MDARESAANILESIEEGQAEQDIGMDEWVAAHTHIDYMNPIQERLVEFGLPGMGLRYT